MKNWFLICVIVLLAASSAAVGQSTVTSAGGEATYVNPALYQSATITSTSQGLKVWSIVIDDDDTDALPTKMYNLNISGIAPGDITYLGNAVRHAALFNGATLVKQASGVTDAIYFDWAEDYQISGTVTLDLYVSFKAGVTDNQDIKYAIAEIQSTDDALITIGESSSFGPLPDPAPSSALGSGKNEFEVTASQLRFSSTPNFVNPGSAFSITVQATDALNNIDLDASNSVGLSVGTGSGILTGGAAQALGAGEKTFTGLQYDIEEWPVTLVTTNGSGLTNGTSDQFEVSGALLIDDFKGTGDADLTGYGWSVAQSGTIKAKVAGAGLSKSGYYSSGRYLAATIGDEGEHVYKNLVASQTANSVYLSFMVRFGGTPSSTDGASELIGLAKATPAFGTDYFGLFSAHASGGNIRFGVSKTMGETAPTWTGYSYTTTTVYLIVLKYTFVSGSDNDVVNMSIDPSLGGSEPSPTLTHTPGGTYGDAPNIGSVVLIQQTGSTTMTIDGIRVSTTWADAALPVQLSAISASSVGLNAQLSWSTATETNNAGFEVERRSIPEFGIRNSEYLKVGFVAGAGTSTSPKEYTFTDANLAPGRYAYRIKQVDRDGGSTYFREVEVEVGATAKAFTLNEAFPNPFNPTTSVDFSLAEQGVASLKIYDVLGREVATIFNGAAEAGRLYRATWDASSMPSGMYFARLESGGMSAMKRLMLVK